MERYLVFDSGCSVCSRLAETVQHAAGSKLEAISIHDPKARTLLDNAYPRGWEPAPYLVFSDQRRVRAWSGTIAALHLAALVGPRSAWRIWAVARRHGIYLPPGRSTAGRGMSRRYFLKLTAGITTALAGLGLAPASALAACLNDCECVNCTEVSNCYADGQCFGVDGYLYTQLCEEWDCYDSRTGDFCWSELRNCCCGCGCPI